MVAKTGCAIGRVLSHTSARVILILRNLRRITHPRPVAVWNCCIQNFDMSKLWEIADKYVKRVAIIGGGIAAGAVMFSYLGDIRYSVLNWAVRNISYHNGQICKGTADDYDLESLADEYARYERYKGRPHHYLSMSQNEICERLD